MLSRIHGRNDISIYDVVLEIYGIGRSSLKALRTRRTRSRRGWEGRPFSIPDGWVYGR